MCVMEDTNLTALSLMHLRLISTCNMTLEHQESTFGYEENKH